MQNKLQTFKFLPAQLIVSILSIVLVFLISCRNPIEPAHDENNDALPPINIPWTQQQSLVCFGTSLTFGYIPVLPVGPTLPASIVQSNQNRFPKILFSTKIADSDTISYPVLLSKKLKIKIFNQGFVGATTRQALTLVGDSIFSKNPALVLLEFGANDFLQGNDSQVVAQQLGRLIDTLHSFGSQVVLISFLFPEMIASVSSNNYFASRRQDAVNYLSMLKRVADSHNILFVEKAMDGIYWNSDLMSSDGMHPNIKGYQRMEANIYGALINTLQKNNMLLRTP